MSSSFPSPDLYLLRRAWRLSEMFNSAWFRCSLKYKVVNKKYLFILFNVELWHSTVFGLGWLWSSATGNNHETSTVQNEICGSVQEFREISNEISSTTLIWTWVDNLTRSTVIPRGWGWGRGGDRTDQSESSIAIDHIGTRYHLNPLWHGIFGTKSCRHREEYYLGSRIRIIWKKVISRNTGIA
jgi:hypothetical protein